MRQSIKKLVVATAMASVLCGMAAAQEVTKGGTLTMPIQQTPRHLNPAVQSGTATGQPGTQLFAPLLRYDDGWAPQPYLAESWNVSEDGLTVTINLVKGATFHDGKPITSEDVAFSIDTVKANHPFKSMFAPSVQLQPCGRSDLITSQNAALATVFVTNMRTISFRIVIVLLFVKLGFRR